MTTYYAYTPEEVLIHWRNYKEEIIPEVAPTLSEATPNLKGPWATDYETAKETFEYIDQLKTKVYVVCIHNHRFEKFILFSPKGEPEIYKPFLKNLDSRLRWTKAQKEELNNTKFKFMSCIVQNESKKKDIEDLTRHPYYTLFKEISDTHEDILKDGMYILSVRDALLVRKDGTHPWPDIAGPNAIPDLKIPKKFLPIFNSTGGIDYWDIPIPTYDDLDYIKNNGNLKTGFKTAWDKKKNQAVFRGSATGCGYTVSQNPRLRVAQLGKKYKSLLNAGITAGGKKYKFHRSGGLGYFDFDREKIPVVPRMSKEEQSKYKYVIEIEGNVAAHRIATDMLFESVPLIIKGEYMLWFEHLLVPYQHYIPIEYDASNLIEVIEWCQNNDQICQIIAKNAYNFASDILKKDIVYNYMTNLINNV